MEANAISVSMDQWFAAVDREVEAEYAALPRPVRPDSSEWVILDGHANRARKAANKIHRMLKPLALESEDRVYLEDLHLRAQSCYLGILAVIAARRRTVVENVRPMRKPKVLSSAVSQPARSHGLSEAITMQADSPARTITLTLTREEMCLIAHLLAKEPDRKDLERRVYAAWDTGKEHTATCTPRSRAKHA